MSYKPIGDFIELVDERNKDLKIKTLVGVSVTKDFIPSVANTIGTNMKNYKIIKKNQFACSLMQVRRDKKIPVSLMKKYDKAIISQAYPVFKITDEEKLLPDYLMMWMSRSEFDREACFYAVGGVRGSLEWEDFCNMKLPVPDIGKQKEIVKEYKTITNRIKLNEQLNKKLEETAQAIYKQWFIDFEFPITKEYAEQIGKPELEGKPYKSNGGEMVLYEVLDQYLPKDWTSVPLNDVSSRITDGSHTSPSSTKNGKPMSSVKDMKKWCLDLDSSRIISEKDYKLLVKGDCKPLVNDILVAKDGSFLKNVFVVKEELDVVILSSIAIIRPNMKIHPDLLCMYLKQNTVKKRLENSVNGAAIQRIILKEFRNFNVILPSQSTQEVSITFLSQILNKCWLLSKKNSCLNLISGIILTKMSKVQR